MQVGSFRFADHDRRGRARRGGESDAEIVVTPAEAVDEELSLIVGRELHGSLRDVFVLPPACHLELVVEDDFELGE